MSTEIIVNNDIIEINVTEEPIIIEAPSGAYPLPGGVYSVFGRTGNVIAQDGDYNLTQLGDVTITNVATGQVLRYNGTEWVNSTESYVGTVTSVAASVPTGLTISGSPITTSGTLAFGLASGYSIPTTASQTTWDTAYSRSLTSASVTGTTTKTLTLNEQGGGTITATWSDLNTDAVTSVFGRTGAVVAQSGDYTTTQVTEGTNLYYTDVRARASNSFVAGSGAYNATTGVITIPTNNNQITNGSNYITLTSLSATAPLSYVNTTGIFSISQATSSVNGYLTSTDWNTFNNKENAISTGTTLQYWRGDKSWQTLDTTAVVEATNLYYTQARFNSAFAAKTTTDLTEGTNLYYTDARARAAITGTSPISVTSGVVSISQANTSTNGYLSFADWNTFNGKQDALNGNGFVKIVGTTISYDNSTYLTTISGITAGGELSGTYANPSLVNSAVTGKVLTGVNITGGTIADTDSILTAFGKVQNQINGLIGGSIYKGTWNASTNNPALASGVGTNGNYYIVSVAGTTNLDGITDWQVGDWAIFHTTWQKVDNTDAVVSVNGFTGAVSLTTSNISEGTSLYYTNARTIASSLTGYTSGAGTISSSDTILTAIQKLNGNIGSLVTGVSSVFGRTGAVVSATGDYTTSQVTEGTNLYYTDTRARASLSFTAGSGAYNSTTGVITIPTNNNQITNGAGYITTADLTGYIPYTGATTAIDLNAKTVVNISNLGINTTSVPTILLRVVGDNNSNSRIAMRGYSSNANSSSIRVTKFRGSAGTPQAPLSGDSLGKFELAGYGTTSSEGYPQASFEGLATENWGATARGSKAVIKITPNTTITQVIALTINQDKSAVFESSVTGTSLIKTGGTSSQFLKADGTVDSSSYITLASLSATSPLSYNNTTGAFTIAQATTSTNGYLSSTDWNTFNGKQNALTNPVTGTGTTNYHTKFTGTSTIGNSLIWDNGTNVGIGNTNTTYKLEVTGSTATTQLWQLADNSTEMKIGRYNSSFPNAYIDAIGPSGDVGFQFRTQVGGAGGGTKMTITSAGNVGIGTSSPTNLLTIEGNNKYIIAGSGATTGYQAMILRNSGTDINIGVSPSNGGFWGGGEPGTYYATIGTSNATSLGFATNSVPRMFITSGGNVGIGTSSPTGAKLDVREDSANPIRWGSTSTQYGFASWDTNIGIIGSLGSSTSLALWTNNTERMRITSGGVVLINQTTDPYNHRLTSNGGSAQGIMASTDTTANDCISFWNKATSGNNIYATFYQGSGVSVTGTISYNRGVGLTAFNTTSDYRLKSQISDFNALEIISNLKPKEFRIGDAENKSIGFIAHELKEYFPQAVTGEKDEVKEDGTPIYQSVDYSQLTGLLVKAIQEQNQTIQELSNRLIKLENK